MVNGYLETGLAALVVAAAVTTLLYALWTGVPPVAARRAEVEEGIALLREAGVGKDSGGRIYELGCGWGGMVVALARAFPGVEVVGIELSPLPWLVAKVRARRLLNATVRRADLFRTPLDDAAAVTAYLMIKPMQKLAPTLDARVREGTAVVAIAFLFRDRTPTAIRRGDGIRKADVALYRWPAK